MAKTGGLGDNFYIGGYDLSGGVNSVDQISGGPNLQDATTINQSAHSRLGLARIAAMAFTTFMDNPAVWSGATAYVTGNQVSYQGDTYQCLVNNTNVPPPTNATDWLVLGGAEHYGLKGLPRTDTVGTYLRSTILGAPAASMNAKQVNYDWTRGNAGELTAKVNLVPNSFGLEWGKQLTAGQRTDTTATTGAFFDDGAGTAFGGQAYFQLIAFTGTSVTIDIQSATTSGGVYSTTGLTSQAFTAAPNSQRVAVANNTTINEFLKVVTTGTFTNAVFVVHFVRNLIAGVVF
jgi:hypothetical protein